MTGTFITQWQYHYYPPPSKKQQYFIVNSEKHYLSSELLVVRVAYLINKRNLLKKTFNFVEKKTP